MNEIIFLYRRRCMRIRILNVIISSYVSGIDQIHTSSTYILSDPDFVIIKSICMRKDIYHRISCKDYTYLRNLVKKPVYTGLQACYMYLRALFYCFNPLIS